METHKKIWGEEKWITNTKKYCAKILCLKKGYRCSYHYHKIKDETFYILKGVILMELGKEEFLMWEGSIIHIPIGAKHRFTGATDAEILEVSTQHFEDDSYRLTDSGRAWAEV